MACGEREETVELLLKSGVVCLCSVIWLGSFGFLEVSLVFTFYFRADVGVSGIE